MSEFLGRSHAGLLLVGILASAVTPSFATTTVNVDWSITKGQSQPWQFGLNLWAGTDATVAAKSAYKNNLNYMAPPLVRLHSAEMVKDGHAKSWINYSNKTWNTSRINTILSNINAPGRDIVINIPRWPDWMDTNDNGKLDSSQRTAFTNWCAELVRQVNVVQGHGIKYFEVLNELDSKYNGDIGTLASIFKEAAAAMRAVDPTIKVGGGAWANPYDNSGIDRFLQDTKGKIDFLTYHHYATGNEDKPLTDIYDTARTIANRSKELRKKIDDMGMTQVELWLDETNIFYNWELDQSRQLMRSDEGLVFDALSMKHLTEAGAVDAIASWNDRDGTYGKTDGNDNLRSSAHLLALANEYLVGSLASNTSSDTDLAQALAIRTDDQLALLIIGLGESTQNINLVMEGITLGQPHIGYQINQGLLTPLNLTVWNQQLQLPASSVQLFVWNTTQVPEPISLVAWMIPMGLGMLQRPNRQPDHFPLKNNPLKLNRSVPIVIKS